jgi:hypothetical protein
VVQDLASDKAPGPDGFIGAFFKASWLTVKHDLMAAVNYFYNQHDQHFKQLNSAHVVLIPKKMEAWTLSDYRPISLSHSIAKLVSKLLANRLAPHLGMLVSRSQSAFIKKREYPRQLLIHSKLDQELNRSKIQHCFSSLTSPKHLIV